MVSLVSAALIVILGAFILGILVGFFLPGKKRKKTWFAVLIFIGFLISLFFALGAYVFTQNSLFYFASAQVGVMTFGGSLLTFGIIFFMFIIGLALGDLHHSHSENVELAKQL